MSQKKKKKKKSPPHSHLRTDMLFAVFDVCILEFKYKESFPAVLSSSSSSPVKLWYCVCL